MPVWVGHPIAASILEDLMTKSVVILGSLTLGVLGLFGICPNSWSHPGPLPPVVAGISGITLFTFAAITFTIVITWVFNNTQASLLLAILVHAFIDTFSISLGAIFPPQDVASALPFIIGFGVVALALILITRGRLNYERLADAPSAEE
jgi:hypothetical protein